MMLMMNVTIVAKQPGSPQESVSDACTDLEPGLDRPRGFAARPTSPDLRQRVSKCLQAFEPPCEALSRRALPQREIYGGNDCNCAQQRAVGAPSPVVFIPHVKSPLRKPFNTVNDPPASTDRTGRSYAVQERTKSSSGVHVSHFPLRGEVTLLDAQPCFC
ncbi:hypothetical protein DPEC_G00276080 [Dallia pectoralis]|uniref:Uncharacterized protein n=1 Tax=Dallia pectoralis TaxID=75939 RepID=A0ACC2FLJ5_DALPE|nr:hypothetical protein DPEC_G00276080 [Dallia pectoralis]